MQTLPPNPTLANMVAGVLLRNRLLAAWAVALAAALISLVSGAAAQPKAQPVRIVVFGDSDFVANGYLGIPGNKDLFLNSVNWLAQQENLISIRPREPESRGVTLTAERARLVFYLSILIIPGLILALGVQTWWRRR